MLDTFMGLSPEYCLSTAKELISNNNASSGAEEQSSDAIDQHFDLTDSMNVLVLFKAANLMLTNCGIHDFTITDLMRPEPARIQRILSGVINLARFRELRLRGCEALARESDEKLQEVRSLEEENQELRSKIDMMKERLQDDAERDSQQALSLQQKSTLSQLNSYNFKLEQELKKLQKSQEVLRQEHSSYKESKTRLLEKLEDHHYLIGEMSREVDKLKGYMTADPELMRKVNDDLRTNLAASEEHLKLCELALRNRATTLESVQALEDELRNLIKIAQEITNDLRKLDVAEENMAKQSEELESKSHTSEELAVHIQRVKRQLEKSEEKIAKLRQQAQEREKSAKDKLQTLEVEYNRLSKDRESKQEALDQVKAESADIEAQIEALRLDFDHEFRSTESAVAKLNSHIREYLQDLNSYL